MAGVRLAVQRNHVVDSIVERDCFAPSPAFGGAEISAQPLLSSRSNGAWPSNRCVMKDGLDAREVKVLGDLLALVLEDQPGSAETALAAIRRRAQQEGVSGGAIKNLFLRLAQQTREKEATEPARAAEAERLHLMLAERSRQLAAAQAEIARLQAELANERAARAPAFTLSLGRRSVSEPPVSEQPHPVGAVSVRRFAWFAIAGALLVVLRAALGTHWPHPIPSVPPAAAPQAPVTSNRGDIELPLSLDQRVAIADHVRACYRASADAWADTVRGVVLVVRTDRAGVARAASVDAIDRQRLIDPAFAEFATRAEQAVLSPQCARLPLPAEALGSAHILSFRFVP